MSSHQNSISAAETSIGFDYQFYYFFYTILGLKHGESIGLEVKDDVHLDFLDGTTILIQTKHSLQTSTDGSVINLTERDKDLWKTISNWVKIINEQNHTSNYLAKTTFQLITNKNNKGNPFFLKIQAVKRGVITTKEFKEYLKTLASSTNDETIKSYITTLSKLKIETLAKFLEKLKFDLNEDNFIERIKERLSEKFIHINRVNDVYDSLHSTLRDRNFLTVKQGDKIEISFDDFRRDFGHCFSVGYSLKLPIRDIRIILPSNPENQHFIRQLLDIHALESFDHDEIIELTTHMLMLYNNLKEWGNNGDISLGAVRKFDENTIQTWKNSFQEKYRKIRQRHRGGEDLSGMESDVQDAALACLDEMRKAILTIEDTQLDTKLSNGHFYLLTEDKKVGWHFDWKNKYGI